MPGTPKVLGALHLHFLLEKHHKRQSREICHPKGEHALFSIGICSNKWQKNYPRCGAPEYQFPQT